MTSTTSATQTEILEHLVESRLAGEVQTSVANTIMKVGRLLEGRPECTFGLSDWRTATFAEVERAIAVTSGASLDVEDQTRGCIDPAFTLQGMDRHAAALASYLAIGGANIIVATGHPTGLLEHYIELAGVLRRAGNRILVTHDDGPPITPATETETERTIRFVGSVACVFDGLSLVHSHLSAYMEAMLDEFATDGVTVDLVVADHGMAGAAVERGIPTISIADVNDPGLPLAHLRGRHRDVLVIDDNLAPALFQPVTRYIIDGAKRGRSA